MSASSSARSSRPGGGSKGASSKAVSSKAQPAKAETAKASPASQPAGTKAPGRSQAQSQSSKASKAASAKARPAGKTEAAAPTIADEGPAAVGERAPEESPRPVPVLIAAAMTGLIAAVLVGYGTYLVIAGFAEQPVLRGRAELAGVIFVLLGLGIAWAACGLGRMQPWARTPSMLAQLMLLGVAYWMHQGGMNVWAAIALAVGLCGAAMLFMPSSHRVLSRDVH